MFSGACVLMARSGRAGTVETQLCIYDVVFGWVFFANVLRTNPVPVALKCLEKHCTTELESEINDSACLFSFWFVFVSLLVHTTCLPLALGGKPSRRSPIQFEFRSSSDHSKLSKAFKKYEHG